jgi:hypothetical protein
MAENTAVFINRANIHKYLLQNFLNKQNEGLYIEPGVASGATINMFADKLPKKTFHGFDAFLGLRDVWSKPERGPGYMNLEGHPSEVASNVVLHIGWVEDTLEIFLNQHPGSIYFVHQDLDVYHPTKFFLNLIKNKLISGSLILFDDYHNFIGWQNHSHKAFTESLVISQFELIAFSFDGAALFKKY